MSEFLLHFNTFISFQIPTPLSSLHTAYNYFWYRMSETFFFFLFLQSLPLFPVSRKSILQDFCWRWKKSIPELRGSKYSVTQLLDITQHTCWKILAIHSLLNSSHHLCEAKQRIRKFHTDKIISTTHIHVVFFFFFLNCFSFFHSFSPFTSAVSYLLFFLCARTGILT